MQKVTVNLPDDAVAALKQLAAEREETQTQVLRRAIASEQFLHEEVKKKGRKLLIEQEGGTLREIQFIP
jgi:predicted transcriptional regulator